VVGANEQPPIEQVIAKCGKGGLNGNQS